MSGLASSGGGERTDSDSVAVPRATGDVPARAPRPGYAPGITLFALLIAGVVVAADQLSKWWAQTTLTAGDPVEVIGQWLRLTLVFNSGAAFSLGSGGTAVISVIALGILVFLLIRLRTVRNPWWALAFGLMIGGALGNLIDRMLRAPGPFRGHVVDFLQLPRWPVFNVADSAVVAGAILMAVLALLGVAVGAEDPDSADSGSVPADAVPADAAPADAVPADALPPPASHPATNPESGSASGHAADEVAAGESTP